MSEAVKNYPEIRWNLPGLRPLQVGIIISLITTSLAGILSNPLFTLANDSVSKTPMLRQSIVNAEQKAATERAALDVVQPEVKL